MLKLINPLIINDNIALVVTSFVYQMVFCKNVNFD